jgi:hypothetical protein
MAELVCDIDHRTAGGEHERGLRVNEWVFGTTLIVAGPLSVRLSLPALRAPHDGRARRSGV